MKPVEYRAPEDPERQKVIDALVARYSPETLATGLYLQCKFLGSLKNLHLTGHLAAITELQSLAKLLNVYDLQRQLADGDGK